jgi:hypothetical protein
MTLKQGLSESIGINDDNNGHQMFLNNFSCPLIFINVKLCVEKYDDRLDSTADWLMKNLFLLGFR